MRTTRRCEFPRKGLRILQRTFSNRWIYGIFGTLSADGQPAALDAGGRALLGADAPGAHPVEVTVTDPYASATFAGTLFVRDPNDVEPPVVRLDPALADALVTAPTALLASVADADLASWRLVVRASGTGAPATVLAQGGAPFGFGPVAELDPTRLINGLHTVVLQA
ncbi:MAG: hypothetical protein GY769_22335, partial [bacterium]|nr:hypothetical protein [bacterium]